jgi:hypothetical protein
VRNIRDAGQHVTERFIQLFYSVVQSGHALVHGAPLQLQLRGVGTLATELPNLSASRPFFCFQLLGFGYRRTSLSVQRSELLNVQPEATRSQALGDGI